MKFPKSTAICIIAGIAILVIFLTRTRFSDPAPREEYSCVFANSKLIQSANPKLIHPY
jgi:hypothetical protein